MNTISTVRTQAEVGPKPQHKVGRIAVRACWELNTHCCQVGGIIPSSGRILWTYSATFKCKITKLATHYFVWPLSHSANERGRQKRRWNERGSGAKSRRETRDVTCRWVPSPYTNVNPLQSVHFNLHSGPFRIFVC